MYRQDFKLKKREIKSRELNRMGKGRQPCCDKSKVKKGPWTPAEDLKLITYIQKHGHDNWRALPAKAGLLRCGKSCRLRWVNYLRPDVKRGNFTKLEEKLIIHLHEVLGNKWSKIASHFPGRTDNEIKNVWNTHLKKKKAMTDTNASKEQSSNSKESTLTSSSLSSSASFNSNSNQVMATVNEHSMYQLDKNFQEEYPRVSNYSDDIPGFPTELPITIIQRKDKEDSPRSLPTNNTNSSNTGQFDILVPEEDMDSLFDLGSSGCDIQFKADSEFWKDLESDDWISSFEFSTGVQEGKSERESYQPCQSSKSAKQSGNENADQQWLFRYLEDELGLEDSSSASQTNGSITSPDKQLVSPNLNYFDATFPDLLIEYGIGYND